jgi:hypothetical protein
MKQKVITPDCPRCGGPLWWVPCPLEDPCTDEHYECEACRIQWVRRGGEWLRFDPNGEVLEILPRRIPAFRRPR